MSSFRRALWMAAAVLGSVLVVAGAAELGLRAWGDLYELRPAGDELGYTLRRGADLWLYHEDLSTNALGFRDDEFTSEDDGRPRILLLGDSFAMGLGVARGVTCADRLEAPARSAGGLRVFNTGVMGYSSLNALAALRELGPRLRPDLVVLFFFLNDFAANETGDPREGYERERGTLRIAQVVRRWLGAGDTTEEDSLAFYLDAFAHLPRPRSGGATATLLRAMVDESGTIGARFLAVYVPSAPETMGAAAFAAAGAARGREVDEEAFRSFRSAFLADAESAGAPVFDLTEAPGWRDGTPLYSTTHNHWTEAGNERCARLLFAHPSVTALLEKR